MKTSFFKSHSMESARASFKVYCLVRSSVRLFAETKLKEKMTDFDSWNDKFHESDFLCVIPADITQEYFGYLEPSFRRYVEMCQLFFIVQQIHLQHHLIMIYVLPMFWPQQKSSDFLS